MATILLVSAKEKAKMGDFPCNQAENLVDNKMNLAQLLKLQAISKSTLYSRFNLLLILSCLHKCLVQRNSSLRPSGHVWGYIP